MSSSPDSSDRPSAYARDERLDSWKEIATYLKRDVTTVRRWEKREALPIHRHQHERRDSVYAYKREIDIWWEGRGSELGGNGSAESGTASLGNGAATEAAGTSQPRLRELAHLPLWLVAVALSAATLIGVWLLISRSTSPATHASEVKFSVFPPEKTSFSSMTVSPDGRHLAFTTVPTSGSGGNAMLWVRPLDSVHARPLPDTEGASFPFWSPTSDALGFFAGRQLWIVDLSGGGPRVVADAPNGRGGTWNRDGIIVFAPDREGGLFRVPATGGTPAPVTTVARPDQRGHVWPEFLPDGHHFVFLADAYENDLERHHLLSAPSMPVPRSIFSTSPRARSMSTACCYSCAIER